MYQIKHASTRARQSLRIRRVIVSRMTRGCVMSLCHAVTGGEVETVRALLARGEDPNQLEEGSPPIGWAMSMLSLKRRREDGHRIQGPDAAGAVRDVFAGGVGRLRSRRGDKSNPGRLVRLGGGHVVGRASWVSALTTSFSIPALE